MAVRAQAIGRTGPAPMPLPAVVAHADWSLDSAKRWLSYAKVERDGGYRAAAPQRVGPLDDLFDRLAASEEPTGTILFGFDFPLGLPRAYAERAGIAGFRGFFDELGAGAWPDFFTVAERAEEIGSTRPFYPLRPGRKGSRSRRDLLDGLGLEDPADLLRRCDRGHGRRRAAGALFWTLGAQQVGKAAIVGWRDLFLPALAAGRDLALWPFDGSLPDLLSRHEIVAAETYPAEVAGNLGLAPGPGGKRAQAARAALAPRLAASAADLGVRLAPELADLVADGFGPGGDGEDPFDALLGLLGLIDVLRGRRPPGPPADPACWHLEGWILGTPWS